AMCLVSCSKGPRHARAAVSVDRAKTRLVERITAKLAIFVAIVLATVAHVTDGAVLAPALGRQLVAITRVRMAAITQRPAKWRWGSHARTSLRTDSGSSTAARRRAATSAAAAASSASHTSDSASRIRLEPERRGQRFKPSRVPPAGTATLRPRVGRDDSMAK